MVVGTDCRPARRRWTVERHLEGKVDDVGRRRDRGAQRVLVLAGAVSATFDSHVRRSVPLYQEGHELVAKLSDFFVGDRSTVYDLGCSTGELTRVLATHNVGKSIRIIGVDAERGMVEEARRKCSDLPGVEIVHADLEDFGLARADLIVSYYTMQFVRPRFRQDLFDRIYRELEWGGAFVLFEKVRAPDARFQDIMTAVYTDYKLDQGYNEAEIIHKARSLKGVLEPFSTQGNIDLMKRAGFIDITTIFKYVCFEGFLAIK